MTAELMESTILEQRIKMERFLSGLGTIGYVSPLLGLLGTVIGLIRAFTSIAVTGSGGPAVVSSGIAEALLTTAVGLIIAVPVIYFYNYFSKRATDIVDEMESVMRRLLQLITASKGGGYEAVTSSGSAPGA
jgi:biopolymer transport protein ExbB